MESPLSLSPHRSPPARAERWRPGEPRRLHEAALAATRAAALASREWAGRGDPVAADRAAVEAMRTALASCPGTGTVVVGEGAKDEAPMLFAGERLGRPPGPEFDIAVDPLECTKLCARGLAGSLATIALAERGALAALAASFYMDKLVGPTALSGAVRIDDRPERTVAQAADALGKPVGELRIVVLDKPRHEALIDRLRRAGARVITPPDGDVAGALCALLPDGDADLLMGVGGTPEGVMTACAARALGGFMEARLAPQGPEEAAALASAGLSVDRTWRLDDLVGSECCFAATGVTGGGLLRAPWSAAGRAFTESILIAGGAARRSIAPADGPLHARRGSSA